MQRLRPVSIEDLLARDEIKLDIQNIEDYITNKTILISGAGGSIGSEICRQVMAQNEKKVLLIDCDMRKPVQHKNFELANRGLSNCIATGATLEKVIQRDVLPNLDILPSGPVPPNPSELLSSAKMTEILNTVRETYDYILLDMPPVLPVTDASVMQ